MKTSQVTNSLTLHSFADGSWKLAASESPRIHALGILALSPHLSIFEHSSHRIPESTEASPLLVQKSAFFSDGIHALDTGLPEPNYCQSLMATSPLPLSLVRLGLLLTQVVLIFDACSLSWVYSQLKVKAYFLSQSFLPSKVFRCKLIQRKDTEVSDPLFLRIHFSFRFSRVLFFRPLACLLQLNFFLRSWTLFRLTLTHPQLDVI